MKFTIAATFFCLLLPVMNIYVRVTGASEQNKTEKLPIEQIADLTSSIEGSVAGPDGEMLKIDVDVTSKVMIDKDKKIKLTYVIHVGKSVGIPLSLCKENNPNKYPVLVWESAESEPYKKFLQDKKLCSVDGQNAVTVSFQTDRHEVTRKLLKIMVGGVVVAATTAPAYTPQKSSKSILPE